jgi:ribosome-binding factor A
MEPHRAGRVAESLRAELEEILNYELNDPRLTAVSVSEVILSTDGRKARIRLAIDGSEAEAAQTLTIIENAKGYVRRVAAERIDLFRAPDLYFESDISPHLREKAEAVLRRIRKTRARDSQPAPESQKNPTK